ncbi:MAG: hypothetical protein PHU25_05450 [Deltaproteobacteria bacterium]|nr:hypothetical protein [Deltaproteobacteria bacterium]
MTTAYHPPYSSTPAMIRLVGEIGESIGRHGALDGRADATPFISCAAAKEWDSPSSSVGAQFIAPVKTQRARENQFA